MKKLSILMLAAAVIVPAYVFARSEPVKVETEEVVAAVLPMGTPAELRLKASDRFEGEKNAPVQIVEFASMTCGHCANFHKSVYPLLKEKYVDTGKVRFTLRALPWDNLAFAVSKVARCAPKENHYAFVDAFFETSESWMHAKSPLEAIKQTARLGGMSGEAVEACLKDESVEAAIRENKAEATEKLGVRATPTFFVNGQKLEGSRTFAELSKLIDEMLAQ